MKGVEEGRKEKDSIRKLEHFVNRFQDMPLEEFSNHLDYFKAYRQIRINLKSFLERGSDLAKEHQEALADKGLIRDIMDEMGIPEDDIDDDYDYESLLRINSIERLLEQILEKKTEEKGPTILSRFRPKE